VKTPSQDTSSHADKPREARVDPLIMMSIALGAILACFAALMTT
jgi:hypothetical protein